MYNILVGKLPIHLQNLITIHTLYPFNLLSITDSYIFTIYRVSVSTTHTYIFNTSYVPVSIQKTCFNNHLG